MNRTARYFAHRRAVTQVAGFLLLASATAPAAAQTPWYSVADLGLFAETASVTTDVRGIDFFGRICGTGVTGGWAYAQLLDRSWTNLGTLGGSASWALDLNRARQVTGRALTTGGTTRAFLWTPGSTNGVAGNPQMKDLGTLGGATSEGAAVNDAGQVAGYARTPTRDHAFLYSGGSLTDIGALIPAYPESYAADLNATGLVVGTAYNASFTTARAFSYNGATVSVGFVSTADPSNSTYAVSVNDLGQIAGYADDAPNYSFAQAYRFNGTNAVFLPSLGGDYTYPGAMNNHGVIVGGSFVDAAATDYRAFVAVGDSTVDLNTRLDSTGAGWFLTEARAINDAGQIIGIGTLSGDRHAFLLTPTPLVTNVAVAGSNVLVTFTAASNVIYTLQGADAPAGPWTDVLTNLSGNGTPITATNVGGAAAGPPFYRVR